MDDSTYGDTIHIPHRPTAEGDHPRRITIKTVKIEGGWEAGNPDRFIGTIEQYEEEIEDDPHSGLVTL